jgi:hypothetical protein
MGNMIVVKKDGDRKAGPHDQEFQPIIFSLDNTFPLVKLGHADKWEPNYRESSSTTGSLLRRLIAGSASGRFMRWFLWLQILLGWLLATLFVAAVSGLVQHGK